MGCCGTKCFAIFFLRALISRGKEGGREETAARLLITELTELMMRVLLKRSEDTVSVDHNDEA